MFESIQNQLVYENNLIIGLKSTCLIQATIQIQVIQIEFNLKDRDDFELIPFEREGLVLYLKLDISI